jgi:membrane-associated phospholipid phosphatase
VDAEPNNKFQISIYSESDRAPAKLIATTDLGTLAADAWNRLPISAELRPNTPYWLVYATNGSNPAVNNMVYDRGNSLQALISSHRDGRIEDVAHFFERAGNFTPLSLVVAAMSLLLLKARGPPAALFPLFYVASLVIVLVLKGTLFEPYSAYPSGHVMRMTFAVLLFAYIWRSRFAYAGAAALITSEAFSVIYMGGHFPDEAVGGLLLGLASAFGAWAFVDRRRSPWPATLLRV